MKKYTDTELLETLLPMLNYSISISSRENVVSVLDMVDFEILENSGRNVDKDFVVALQNRIDKLANQTRAKATNNTAEYSDDYKEEQKINKVCMPTEDNRDYKEEYRKMVKENHRLKIIIESLLEEIDYLKR